MSYNKSTSFAVKDTMADNNPLKVLRGKEFDDEFDAITVAMDAQDDVIANLVSTPTGGIIMTGAAVAPSGFLYCDGTAYSRNTYTALFQAIGTTFGAGDGATTFNVPNLSNRFPYGTTRGQVGGSADTVLPSHSHNATSTVTINDPGHQHASGTPHIDGGQYGSEAAANIRQAGWGNAFQAAWSMLTSARSTGISASASVNVASAGVNATNANLPPFLGVSFIIKI